MAVYRQISPASLLSMPAGNFQRAVVHESGMFRTHMGMHNRQEMVEVHGTSCAIPPRNFNSNISYAYNVIHTFPSSWS
jgi:hypothetical protein